MADSKRISVGFAIEGRGYRDMLCGQSRLDESPIEYPGNYRQSIRGIRRHDAVLSKNTRRSADARGTRNGTNAPPRALASG
jgi:hypothetical protein